MWLPRLLFEPLRSAPSERFCDYGESKPSSFLGTIIASLEAYMIVLPTLPSWKPEMTFWGD